jgi:hypothetical protein
MAMVAITGNFHAAVLRPAGWRYGVLRTLKQIFTLPMIWSRPGKSEAPRDLGDRFHEFLDGYFNSFDYYPVCTRHVFARNDAYALWSDFLKVAGDVSQATEHLVISPERFLELGAISDDDLEKLKKQAAKKGISRAIQQASRK